MKWLSGICLSFGAGAFAALAMAPHYLWPALFVSFPLYYLCLVRDNRSRAAFVFSWLFSFGYFLFSMHWISKALLVEGNPYEWAWPLAMCALPAGLAFFLAIIVAIISRYYDTRSLSGFIALVLAVFLADVARGFLFSGFPWNFYAHSWTMMLPIIQIARYGSVYLVDALTIFWALTIGFLLFSQATFSRRLILTSVALASFCLNYSTGFFHLRKAPAITGLHPNDGPVQVKLVQPNIPQEDKWDQEHLDSNFKTLLSLSMADASTPAKPLTLIVWPETALSMYQLGSSERLQQINNMLAGYQGDARLISGALFYDGEQKGLRNAVVEINKSANIRHVYSKHFLVPFGEYIPFQEQIGEFIPTVTRFSGFLPGDQVIPVSITPSFHYSPNICYELIFPFYLPDSKSSNMVINVTNDGWFGDSAGPYQHFSHSIFRAIETGQAVVRVSNRGISGVVDPYGRIVLKTQLLKKEAVNYFYN